MVIGGILGLGNYLLDSSLLILGEYGDFLVFILRSSSVVFMVEEEVFVVIIVVV